MMWHGGWSGTDWMLMSLGMLVFWTLVVGAVLWVVAGRRPTPPPQTPPAAPNPEPPTPGAQARALLDERFARGDLTPEEYRLRRDLLSAP